MKKHGQDEWESIEKDIHELFNPNLKPSGQEIKPVPVKVEISKGLYNKIYRSNSLYTLLEWCFSSKEPVSFLVKTEKGTYKTMITFQDYPSSGKYLEGTYKLYLLVKISYKDRPWYTTLITSNLYPIEDTIEELLGEMKNLDNYYGL